MCCGVWFECLKTTVLCLCFYYVYWLLIGLQQFFSTFITRHLLLDFDDSSRPVSLHIWDFTMADKICCVPGCGKSRSDDISLHLFPNPEKDVERYRTWLNTIAGDSTISNLLSSRLTMSSQKEAIRCCIEKCLKVVRLYDWLLDLYVLDFFVDNHWEKLPASWRECFDKTDPSELGLILTGKPSNKLYPLSFLALINTIQSLSIPREQNFTVNTKENSSNDLNSIGGNPNLKNLFLKHVKLKKRHEISLMAAVVADTASKSQCPGVVDFGSGLGHLVRMLAYKYELVAAGIECQVQLSEEARNLDLELEYTAKKHLAPTSMANLQHPTHINITLSSLDQLNTLPLNTTDYGLVGLHPCGDLGPLLLKHFIHSNKVKYICLVGCCFMKLTDSGYPLSEFVKGLKSELSYVSREIACHAIEVYCERLVEGNFDNLKVHAFRAALEYILVTHNPELKHAPVRSIKHSNTLTFERYCTLATEKLNLSLGCDWSTGLALVSQWRRVVTVYTLRLALAPLVETVILLDRVLYVLEQGSNMIQTNIINARLMSVCYAAVLINEPILLKLCIEIGEIKYINIFQ